MGSNFYLGNGVSLTAVIYTGQFPKSNASSEWLVIYMLWFSFVFVFLFSNVKNGTLLI